MYGSELDAISIADLEQQALVPDCGAMHRDPFPAISGQSFSRGFTQS